eukprot:Gb_41474 [translate_table: standard]
MDKHLRESLHALLVAVSLTIQISLQAWFMLQDTTNAEQFIGSINRVSLLFDQFKKGNEGVNEITPNDHIDEDVPMTILFAKSIVEEFMSTLVDITASQWDGMIQREWHIKPQSLHWWNHYIFHVRSDDLRFQSIFQLPIQLFDEICQLLQDDLSQGQMPISFAMSIKSKVLSAEKQVAIAILRLATGMTMLTISELFGCGKSTVIKVVKKCVLSLKKRAGNLIQWPTDLNSLHQIKEGFHLKQGFPNCCGAIDATHIQMDLPYNESSIDWYDCEHNYSMLVQAIVDSNMRFLDICTGWLGSLNDTCLLRNSSFYRLCEGGERFNGHLVSIGTIDMREYIVGDGGYPLLPWLIIPFSGAVTNAQKLFNFKLSSTCIVVERAFGKLKNTWRLLQNKVKNPNLELLPRIIIVCCILHNMLLSMETSEDEYGEEVTNEETTSF